MPSGTMFNRIGNRMDLRVSLTWVYDIYHCATPGNPRCPYRRAITILEDGGIINLLAEISWTHEIAIMRAIGGAT